MIRVATAVYGLFGFLALAAGVFVIVWPSALSRTGDPEVVPHLLQEQAAAFVFIGLICLWCVTQASARRPVHRALFVFTVLYAGVHWWGALGGNAPSLGSYATLVPVALLAITWPRSPAG